MEFFFYLITQYSMECVLQKIIINFLAQYMYFSFEIIYFIQINQDSISDYLIKKYKSLPFIKDINHGTRTLYVIIFCKWAFVYFLLIIIICHVLNGSSIWLHSLRILAVTHLSNMWDWICNKIMMHENILGLSRSKCFLSRGCVCIYNAYLRGDSFANANRNLHKKIVLEIIWHRQRHKEIE